MTIRRFWLKRRPMGRLVRGFRLKYRLQMEKHFGLSLRDFRQFMLSKRKRHNIFIKRTWWIPVFDRHGRPPNDPVYQKPKTPR
jgi:hypothetical protein